MLRVLLLASLGSTACLTSMQLQSTNPDAPRLGLLFEVCDGARGSLITHVEPGLAAHRAGMQDGDVLESIDGALLDYYHTVPQLLERRRPGEQVHLVFHRGGQAFAADTTLDPMGHAIVGSGQGFKVGGCGWGLGPVAGR